MHQFLPPGVEAASIDPVRLVHESLGAQFPLDDGIPRMLPPAGARDAAEAAQTERERTQRDREAPRFAVREGPPWLKVDPATGLLSGNPDRPGKVAIVVTATIDRDVRRLDAGMLSWGLEKVLSTGAQRVGVATQKFTIDVAP